MLDIGSWEFMLVAFVLILVVGPKELPKMLRGFTRLVQQGRNMAREFSNGMHDLAREADMAELKDVMDNAKSGKLDDIANAIDPTGDIGSSIGGAADALKTDTDLADIKSELSTTGAAMAAEANKPAAKKAKSTGKKAPAKKAASKKAPAKKAPAKKAPAKKGAAKKSANKKAGAKKSATKGTKSS
ncbi:twin-arginine translocase subunit TatB [Alphaproteobacteria bacterium]|nr:twin-arginine translocase subunit TatB [Alphaproteobacteria bacterium]